ncbi:MAG: DNA mismatch repair protein MutS [Spirochaetota bacterium]
MADESTPMMRQYREIKAKYPDAFLFFRLGDFYEMFFDDAVEASRILELTLTKRNDIPMCGVPYHAADNYLARMIKAGKKVAICDQLEDPRQAKGIVKRDVTQVMTPGTVIENRLLDGRSNNYTLSIALAENGESAGIAVADVSTGEFISIEIAHDPIASIADEIARFAPKEILIPDTYEENADIAALLKRSPDIYVSRVGGWSFAADYARDTLIRHFAVATLKGFGIDDTPLVISAAGGLIHYLSEMQKSSLSHIRTLSLYNRSAHMVLDDATQTSLELAAVSGKNDRTLLSVIDETLTGMGARRLKQFIVNPLIDANAVNERLDRVDFFVTNAAVRSSVRDDLKQVHDIERLVTRLALGRLNPKDMVSLKLSLMNACAGAEKLLADGYKDERFASEKECRVVIDIIERALLEEPAIAINEGGIIKDGFDATLAKYNEARREGRQWILALEEEYKKETGISNLRIRYNNIIGYFIEVTKGQLKNVTSTFIKRQTLVGSERFTTEKLSAHEAVINDANEKGNSLEEKIYLTVREEIRTHIDALKSMAEAIALADVFSALAQCAVKRRYTRPHIDTGSAIDIKDGRHPVVEEYLSSNAFIPNDVTLDASEHRLIIITGPNMSGKSTYLRQTALIVLLAQIGSFVPAREASIGIVDRIFTRVGASDNIARGESTFLVEMNETANILNNCTNRSLIIMDEIGRGTSTYDGMAIAWAIAWAIVEYLSGNPKKAGKTLFATHYHELTLLEELPGVKNASVLVREHKGEIVFMKKVVAGPAKASYGIYAAKLAGVPGSVTTRAEAILAQLERDGEVQVNILEKGSAGKASKKKDMLPLFADEAKESEIEAEIRKIDADTLTPLAALQMISTWKERLHSGDQK